MSTTIDTTKVTERRSLHFDSLDDISADLDHLAASGEVRALWNWSPGQLLKHLATALYKSIDGFENPLPGFVRVIFRTFFKNKFLTASMSAGFKLPKKALAELVPAPVSFEDGVQSLRQAIHRLQTETQRAPNPVLGPLSVEEWNQLHCRHCELHLSFLVPSSRP
jgi:hypothetical protein